MWHPPGGMRTPDRGSTTGNASWTDREPASGLPRRGERSESIPPSAPAGGDENPRPGFDEWQRHPDRTKKTNLMILSHFVLQGLVKQK
ncbi:hypothetical protein B7475_18035 [Klebsiella pneumoniae]|nr:hypothetical protein B7475_18035 [Klebsiella pneumoniae]